MIAVSGRPYQIHVLRLLPDEDVRATLEAWCKDRSIEAASIVSAVGSVSIAALRFAGRNDPARITADLEVCALSGTLSRYGSHLHLAVADAAGKMSGGHLLTGTNVRTTLEITIQEIGGLRMIRKKDERTGYDELFPELIAP